MHLHPFYRKLGFKKGDYKFAEDHATRSISLPIFPGLKRSKVELITKLINNFFKNEKKIKKRFLLSLLIQMMKL